MLPFARRGLRVLMYHRVGPEPVDALTVTPGQLAQQLAWLRTRGATFVTLQQVLDACGTGTVLPAWPVLVTFDDGYVDTYECARPVLDRAGVTAVVFVPGAYIGRTSAWDPAPQPLMPAELLRGLVGHGWEIALHSHRHVSFRRLAPEAVTADLRQNFAALQDAGVPALPALAYPFGHRPKRAAERDAMCRAVQAAGVRLAFRIGNRINPLPLRTPFEVNRLGVEGTRSFRAIQMKLSWGRLF